MNHTTYKRHVLPSMIGTPRFERLPARASVQVLSLDPPVYLSDDFLSVTEVQHIRELGDERLQPSEALATPTSLSQHYLSSSTSYFDRHQTPLLQEIEARALNVSGAQWSEPLQVVQYLPSQETRNHFDWFSALPGSAQAIGSLGQRTVTFFVYLDSLPIEAEGETRFPRLAGCACVREAAARYSSSTRCPRAWRTSAVCTRACPCGARIPSAV